MYRLSTHCKDVIEGFVDADYEENVDTRKSLSRYVFTLFGTEVCWKTLQFVVALSTTQVEYIALIEGVKKALWLKGMIAKMECVTIHCDSQSVIHLANHQIYHERTKHIDVRLQFMRAIVESKEVRIMKATSKENLANVFIKSLPRSRFNQCLE